MPAECCLLAVCLQDSYTNSGARASVLNLYSVLKSEVIKVLYGDNLLWAGSTGNNVLNGAHFRHLVNTIE